MSCLRKLFAMCAALILSVLVFAGCESVRKEEVRLDTSVVEYALFDYNGSRTKIEWATVLTNDTIYDVESFSVTFELYSGSTFLGTETFDYDCKIGHGDKYIGKCVSYVDGEVDSIEFVSWRANHAGVWGTYKIWFIVVAALVVVALVVARIAEFELDDLDLDDHIGLVSAIGAPLLCAAITSIALGVLSWFPAVIVFGGVLAFVVAQLISERVFF